MKELLEQMEKNPELKTKIEELNQNPHSVPQDYIQAAAEYGLALTEEDFRPAAGLSDSELEAVAGGDYCYCALGGGGKSSEYDKTCACVAGGGGEYAPGSREHGARCVCVVGGAGDSAVW